MKSKQQVLDIISLRLYNCYFNIAKLRRAQFEIDELYELAMEEYAQQFASQPPSGKYWEEVDAVKEPPGEDGRYWTIIYHGWYGKKVQSVTEFKNSIWHIGKSHSVISYLRPVTGQRYSEEDVRKALADSIKEFGEGKHEMYGWNLLKKHLKSLT